MQKNFPSSKKSLFRNTPYQNAYFWTQTIKPTLAPYSPMEQLVKTIDDIKTILNQYNCEVYVELTQTYVLHYHIIVWCNSSHNDYLLCKRIQASIYKYNSVLGRQFTVNPFTSKEEFEERRNVYVHKDFDRTKRYLPNLTSPRVYSHAPIDIRVNDIEDSLNDESQDEYIEKVNNQRILKEKYNNLHSKFKKLKNEFEATDFHFECEWIDHVRELKKRIDAINSEYA